MKTKTKTTKKDNTTLRAEPSLLPLIKYVEETRGAANVLADELAKRTGNDEYPSNVRLWLATNRSERREMRYGVALLLLDIWQDIQSGKLKVGGQEP